MTTQQHIGIQRPKYEPTPKQITAACERIREGWSVTETANRITCESRISWQLPQLSVSELTSEPEGFR